MIHHFTLGKINFSRLYNYVYNQHTIVWKNLSQFQLLSIDHHRKSPQELNHRRRCDLEGYRASHQVIRRRFVLVHSPSTLVPLIPLASTPYIDREKILNPVASPPSSLTAIRGNGRVKHHRLR